MSFNAGKALFYSVATLVLLAISMAFFAFSWGKAFGVIFLALGILAIFAARKNGAR